MTGMMEGFFWFEIFDSGIFLGTKIWQVYFFGELDLSTDFFFRILKRIFSALAAKFCE